MNGSSSEEVFDSLSYENSKIFLSKFSNNTASRKNLGTNEFGKSYMSRCYTDLHLRVEIHLHETLCIWYHLYNLKNVKNIHGGVLLLVKLQT